MAARASAGRMKLLLENYISAKKEGRETGDFDIAPVHKDSMEEFYILLKPTTGIYKDQYQVLTMKTTYGSGTVYQYPLQAPLMKFETAVYHTNISTSGSICLDILKDATKWMPAYDFTQVVMNIILLYQDPNNSSPFNGEASRNYVDCEHKYKNLSKGVEDFQELERIREECFKDFKAHADKYAKKNNILQYAQWFPQITGGPIDDSEMKDLEAQLEQIRSSRKKKTVKTAAAAVVAADSGDHTQEENKTSADKVDDKTGGNSGNSGEPTKPAVKPKAKPNRWAKHQKKT